MNLLFDCNFACEQCYAKSECERRYQSAYVEKQNEGNICVAATVYQSTRTRIVTINRNFRGQLMFTTGALRFYYMKKAETTLK